MQCPECGKGLAVVCGARRTKSPEARCRLKVKVGRRCRLHGGKSLKGPASPAFRDGRRSRYVPAAYRGEYETALAEVASQASLRHEIALLDAMAATILEGLETGESEGSWERLRNEMRHLENQRKRMIALQREAAHLRASGQLSLAESKATEAGRLNHGILTHLFEVVAPIVREGAGQAAVREEYRRHQRVRTKLLAQQTRERASVPLVVLQAFRVQMAGFVAEFVPMERMSEALEQLERMQPTSSRLEGNGDDEEPPSIIDVTPVRDAKPTRKEEAA